MSEKLNEIFLPKKLMFWFGEDKGILTERQGNLFVVDQELKEKIECEEIRITTEDNTGFIDSIPREIKLSKGDILHFEYKLDVKFG